MNVGLLELRVLLWNSTNLIGIAWSTQPTEATALTDVSVDISNMLYASETYNLVFEVYTEISTHLEVNLSLHYDSIAIRCQNSSGLHLFADDLGGRSLPLIPTNGQLDIRFNFTVPEGNMSLAIYAEAPVPFTVWIFNISAAAWDNLTNINTVTFGWTTVSNIPNFDV